MQFLKISNPIMMSAMAAVVASAVLMVSFLALEPSVGRAATDVFTIGQTITSELSITASTSDVTLSPSIAGLTGGIGNGSTEVVVTTNNATGYSMTIQFSSSTAMYRNGGGLGNSSISNYTATSTADRLFDEEETYAMFGYSVYAPVTEADDDIHLTFLDDGSALCGVGTDDTVSECWLAPSSTAAQQIVDRGDATLASGATTTVQFRVDVPAGPVPAVPTGTYTATATLTAVTQ
jgi:hypothetical protein